METEEKMVEEDLREEVNGVAALLDALLPVLHEVAQGEQGVVAHRDHVFQRPGVHGHQHDASVELILVDLLSSKKQEARHKTEVKEAARQRETASAVTPSSTHRVGHVHHRFGKVLCLRGGTMELHKLTRSGQTRRFSLSLISSTGYEVQD